MTKKATVRQIRDFLFEVEDQNLTVDEIRQILFNVEEQDEELTDRKIRLMTK